MLVLASNYLVYVKTLDICGTYVYLGKNATHLTEDQGLIDVMGKSGAVVVSLVNDLLGEGYPMFIDKWYTSEALVKYLDEHRTGATGTLRKNCVNDSFLKEKTEKGECIFR